MIDDKKLLFSTGKPLSQKRRRFQVFLIFSAKLKRKDIDNSRVKLPNFYPGVALMLAKFVRPDDAHLPGISLLHDFKQGAHFFNIINSILTNIHKDMSLFNANLGCWTVFLYPRNQYATLYPPQI